MNDIKVLLDKYNYKIEKISVMNKIKIIETDNGKFVIKKVPKDTKEIFNYLKSRNFNNYLDCINDNQDNFMIFPYINEISTDKEDKAKDLIYLMSLLHNKTCFYKKFPIDEIKKIYEENIETLDTLEKYYDSLKIHMEDELFTSPSNYYLLRNISWIFHSINSSKFYLDKWYNTIKDKKNKRICLIHGNLEFDHLIESDNKYLISWDNARNDSLVYDLITFYRKNYKDTSFYNLFNLYESYFPLLEEERYFLFSLMLFPSKLKQDEEEILNMEKVYNMINYLKCSNEIVSNYHSSDTDSKDNKHKK